MLCRATMLFYLVVAVLGVTAMLGACGQKGPLYLPEAATATGAGAGTPPASGSVSADIPRVREATVPGASVVAGAAFEPAGVEAAGAFRIGQVSNPSIDQGTDEVSPLPQVSPVAR